MKTKIPPCFTRALSSVLVAALIVATPGSSCYAALAAVVRGGDSAGNAPIAGLYGRFGTATLPDFLATLPLSHISLMGATRSILHVTPRVLDSPIPVKASNIPMRVLPARAVGAAVAAAAAQHGVLTARETLHGGVANLAAAASSSDQELVLEQIYHGAQGVAADALAVSLGVKF